jgi:DNA-binding transcriptional MocR family regulator
VAQIDLETDVTDLGPGQPDPSLLPVAIYRSAMDRALRRHKAGALGYGANAGPLPAREALARWSAEIEQADCDARNVFVTARCCCISAAHVGALAIAEVLDSGDFANHLLRLRGEYQQRCELLLGALAPLASLGVQWDQPEGGFFAWLKLPDGLRASQVHDAALKRGVRVLPGLGSIAAASAENDSWIRTAFSLYPAKVLAAAGERLVAAALETSRDE